MKYIFKTKFAKDQNKNGKEIKIIKDFNNGLLLIQFIDTKEKLKVYDTEIEEVYI